MTRTLVLRLAIIVMLVGVAFAGMAPTPVHAGPVEQLPLSQFLEEQGNKDVWYEGEPALFAWTGRPPDYPRMGWIDYLGAASKWRGASLGTEVTGTFTRKSVGADLVEYAMIVHAKHALAWCVRAFDENGDWDGATLLFGHHLTQVLEGKTPAFGRSTLKATWRQNAGTDIADINLAANYCDGTDCQNFPYRPDG